MENSIYKYVSGAERLIFMSLPDNPSLTFVKIIDKTFINIFSKFMNVDMSRFVAKETYNQIVGGIIAFKISPDIMDKISENEDILDASFVVTSMGIFCILKKFLYTNDTQINNTLSEISAYIDIEIKTQFEKYGITNDDFLVNREMSLFLALSGVQTYKLDDETKEKVKKSYFNLFRKKTPKKEIPKEQLIPEEKKEQVLNESDKKDIINDKNSNKKNSVENFGNPNSLNNKEGSANSKDVSDLENGLKKEGELKYIVKEFIKYLFLPEKVINKAEKDRDEATLSKYKTKKQAIEIENQRMQLKSKLDSMNKNQKEVNSKENKNTEEPSDDVGL